jgi:hypothetical protein
LNQDLFHFVHTKHPYLSLNLLIVVEVYCRVKAKLSEMETDIRKFKNEREKMKESLLDLKCRSMKYNLVFTGLMFLLVLYF